jgi:phosphatidylinositol-3-phosphatase
MKRLLRLMTVTVMGSAVALLVSGPGPAARAAGIDVNHPCGVTSTPPAYQHVVVIAEENKSYQTIFGSYASSAPYLNKLKSLCGTASNMNQLSDTSLADYVAMTSGYTGHNGGREVPITSNRGPKVWPQDSVSIFEHLGANAVQLAESMPSNCYMKGAGDFTPVHTPYQYYTRIQNTLCPQYALPLALQNNYRNGTGATGNPAPDISRQFTLIIPNKVNDGHRTDVTTTTQAKIAATDQWLSVVVPKLLASPQYQAGNTVIIITWDEGKGSPQVPFVVISPSTPAGASTSRTYDHYSLLRGIQELLGDSPLLGHAAGATSIDADPAFNLR